MGQRYPMSKQAALLTTQQHHKTYILFILTSDMKGKKRARRREPTPHIASKDYESPNERNGWGRGM